MTTESGRGTCAIDEAQPGPRLVDGADFVVDEAARQRHLAHDVLRHVGGHAGGALRPRHPQPAVGLDAVLEGGDATRTPSGSSPSVSSMPSGAPTRANRASGAMPSLRGSGVPE